MGEDGTQVTAEPATGYHFIHWSDGLTVNPRTDTNVTRSISVTANFFLLGDVNQDGSVDLSDTVTALQVTTGIVPIVKVAIDADVNVDGKIGIEEVIYTLREVVEF